MKAKLELDAAIYLDKKLAEVAPELHQFAHKTSRQEAWIEQHYFHLLFGALSVLAMLRIGCSG